MKKLLVFIISVFFSFQLFSLEPNDIEQQAQVYRYCSRVLLKPRVQLNVILILGLIFLLTKFYKGKDPVSNGNLITADICFICGLIIDCCLQQEEFDSTFLVRIRNLMACSGVVFFSYFAFLLSKDKCFTTS